MNAQADAFLPQLRDRARLLRAELERERAVVVDIEACDQDELAEWRTVINEQKYVLTPLLDTAPAHSIQATSRHGDCRRAGKDQQARRPQG